MKRSEWQRAYDPDPVRLEARVRHTLANLDAAPAARPRALRTALIAALVLALLGGIALAVYESRTADLAGWFGGEERKDELLSGDIAPSGESTRLGDVIYTLDDVIYKDGTIYGSGVIRAAEGANIVLIDENSGIHEPAGYPLHYGKDYTVPDDAPSGEPGSFWPNAWQTACWMKTASRTASATTRFPSRTERFASISSSRAARAASSAQRAMT